MYFFYDNSACLFFVFLTNGEKSTLLGRSVDWCTKVKMSALPLCGVEHISVARAHHDARSQATS